MFYNARWYDPYLNRFTQADSIIPNPSNVLDWNRYSYVRYNPLKYTDPSGHCIGPFRALKCALTAVFVLGANIASVATRGHGLTDQEVGDIADMLYPASHAGTQSGIQLVAAAGEHGVVGSFELVTTDDGEMQLFSSGVSTLPGNVHPKVPDEMMTIHQASIGIFRGPIDGELFKTTSDFSGYSVSGFASGTIILPALGGDVWQSVNIDSRGNVISHNDIHGKNLGVSFGLGPVVSGGIAMMYSEPLKLPKVEPGGWSKLVCRSVLEMCGR
jgi:hypothetical protein